MERSEVSIEARAKLDEEGYESFDIWVDDLGDDTFPALFFERLFMNHEAFFFNNIQALQFLLGQFTNTI